MRRELSRFAAPVLAVATWVGCGASSTLPREHWEHQLRAAIRGTVSSREENQQNSRLVEQALDEGALKNMMRFEVKAAIGPGESCQAHPECSERAFQSDDWYYEVGSGDEEAVGKRPVIIVGFGPQGRVVRTWNLRVH